jgi:hypothetical protein
MGRLMDQFYIEKILKESLIVVYLEEKGIFPSQKHSDKYVYKCPLHEGDNDPSFVVYLKGEDSNHQDYFCFSCHRGGNLINLVSDLEQITTYQAYLNLLKKLDIRDDGRGQFHIASVQEFLRYSELKGMDRTNNSEYLFLKINTVLRQYLEKIKYDKDEVLNIEKLYPSIDKAALELDTKSLEKIYLFLVSGEALTKRVKKVQENKIKKIAENNWKI